MLSSEGGNKKRKKQVVTIGGIPVSGVSVRGGVPLGANTDVFKSYAGDKLSQAEFERVVLGVSTATEISVKSEICVKGHCFNADDMGKLLPGRK